MSTAEHSPRISERISPAHSPGHGLVVASVAMLDSIWLMDKTRGMAAWNALQGVSWNTHAQSIAAVPVRVEGKDSPLVRAGYVSERGDSPYDLPRGDDQNNKRRQYILDGGVAVIEMTGSLTKQESWSMDGTSTVRVRRAVRQAAQDTSVQSILLLVDSPGGQVSGTHDLAMDVRKAAMQKPVYAYCDDCCASAAYYVASQANFVYAGTSAMVGSIGVYMVAVDMSQMAEDLGVQVIVLKDGDMKGAGEPGTPVTPEQIAHWQGIVDFYGSQFRTTVSQMRFPDKPLTKGQSPADGSVFMGAAARRAGLVDGITTLDNVLSAMRRKKKPAAD